MPLNEWRRMQEDLVQKPAWILDGDLGPYDDANVRVGAADTVILLDFSIVRCAWRALRRSRERWDFWRWLLTYRPKLPDARHATLYVLHNPREIDEFCKRLARVEAE
jgi:hypothetical protein